MCSLITGQAWHFAPCLRVACASSLLKRPPGMFIISLVPTQDLNPAGKATLHSPNPFPTTALLISPLSGLVCPLPSLCYTCPSSPLVPRIQPGSISVLPLFGDKPGTEPGGLGYFFLSFPLSMRPVSWVTGIGRVAPKPSETKESKPNTAPHCWVTPC